MFKLGDIVVCEDEDYQRYTQLNRLRHPGLHLNGLYRVREISLTRDEHYDMIQVAPLHLDRFNEEDQRYVKTRFFFGHRFKFVSSPKQEPMFSCKRSLLCQPTR